jgi:hypothetical protein
MVLFAVSLLVLLMAVGVAVDGGFGLLQYRQAQNAADFAATAAANALVSNCDGDLSPTPITGQQVVQVINDEVNLNAPAAKPPPGNPTAIHWTATYIEEPSPGTFTSGGAVTPTSSTVPNKTCGVKVTVSPQWPPFIEQIMGVTQLRAVTGASAINNVQQGGPLTSIVSLGENGAHTILMAGDGQFDVKGTIFDNANGWLDPNHDNWSRPDVIDGKENGTMTDYGNIQSVANPPWDWCFGSASNQPGPPVGDPIAPPPWSTATQSTPDPWNSAVCSANNTTINYYNWNGGEAPITTDPIKSDPNAPPPPTTSDAYCPGSAVKTYSSASQTPSPGGVATYSPGVYTYTVQVTGNATFQDCPGGYSGIYIFEKGLVLRPAAGDQVTGSDVLFFTQQPPDQIAGVQNQGDGEPVIGAFGGSCNGSGYGNDNCNPVNSGADQTVSFNPNPVNNQGLNDSVEMGGGGTITLSAPTSGTWLGFLLWQDWNTPANFGFDAMLGDSANINLTGILFNDSQITGQNLSNETYWGDHNGIPYLPGGMLVAGFGVDSSTGMTCEGGQPGSALPGNPTNDPQGCHVTIHGLATVDLFQTQGDTILEITGSTFHIPGIQGSAILTQ